MTSFIHSLKIGSFRAPNNIWLAPMAGVTDGPFRALCLRGGAGVVCAEMVSAHALHYANERSLRMLRIDEREKPVSMQIFGADEQTIAQAALAAQERGADIVLYGHTHRAAEEERNGVLFVNPGSLAKRETEKSYAYLVLQSGKAFCKIVPVAEKI